MRSVTGNIAALEYAPAASWDVRRQRWRRRAVLLLIVAAVVFAWTSGVPAARHRVALFARERAALKACLRYVEPADRVVFDESVARPAVRFFPDGVRAEPLYRHSRADAFSVELVGRPAPASWELSRPPAAWCDFLDASVKRRNRVRCVSGMNLYVPDVDAEVGTRDHRGHALLLMHARRPSARGPRRLVRLTFDGPAFVCDVSRSFAASVSRVGWNGTLEDGAADGFDGRVACDGFAPPADRPVRLYAGQPDPADESRFTVRVTIGDQDGLIEGRLHDDDRVTLAYRAAR